MYRKLYKEMSQFSLYSKLIPYLVSASIGVFCTWYVMDLKIDHIKAKHHQKLSQISTERTQELLDRNEYVRKIEKKYNDIIDSHQESITKKEEEYQKKVTARIIEAARLRHLLNSGTWGVRLTTAPANRVHLHSTEDKLSTQSDCRGCQELDPGLRETYVTLREGIQEQYEKLILCKQYAEEMNKVMEETK